jgi:hypothetical protein
VVGYDVGEQAEPEARHAGEDLALAGNGLGHDDVERRDPVGRDHQHQVVADGVVLADLAARQQRERVQGRLQQWLGHDCD